MIFKRPSNSKGESWFRGFLILPEVWWDEQGNLAAVKFDDVAMGFMVARQWRKRSLIILKVSKDRGDMLDKFKISLIQGEVRRHLCIKQASECW